jgi:ferredoxin
VAGDASTVNIGFLQPDGETTKTVSARVGESFLQTAHRYEIDLEGACEGMKKLVV